MTLNTSIRGLQIEDVSISGAHLVTTGSGTPTDGQVLTWNDPQKKFEWEDVGSLEANEIPAGAVNGSNTIFTFAETPVAGTEMIHLNGLLQEPGILNDYTVSGAQITFVFAPETGDIILATYLTNQGLGAASGEDHGTLSGLADDDHTQYILIDGSRAFTGDIQANASGTLDIGSTSLPFKDLYLAGNSVYIAGTKAIGYTGGEVTFYGDGSSMTGISSVHNDLSGLQGGDTNEYYHLNVHEEAQYVAANSTSLILGVAGDGNASISIDSVAQTVNITASGSGTDIDLDDNGVYLNPKGQMRASFRVDGQLIGEVGGTILTVNQSSDLMRFYIANEIELFLDSGGMKLTNSTAAVNEILNTADLDAIDATSSNAQLATAKLIYDTIEAVASGVNGYFDDGVNFRCTVEGGIITAINASVAGGYSVV